MSKGIKTYTPTQAFALQDYGEAIVKLSPDGNNTYFYLTQPLYEFTSPYGIKLSILIMANNEAITYAFPFLMHIKKVGALLWLYDATGAIYEYQKEQNQNIFVAKEGYSSIEVQEKQYCILTQNNQDKYEFTYNSTTQNYEISKIELKSTNESETTITKESQKTIIQNTKNKDVVEIEYTTSSCYIKIKREDTIIKKYELTSGNQNKKLSIKYSYEDKIGNQSTYFNEEVKIQNKTIIKRI